MRIHLPSLLAALLLPVGVFLSGDLATARAAAQPALTNESAAEFIARLRNEGTNRSQMAEIFGYLTDVIGPRLTGSPNCRRANDWTRDKVASWGLTNAHLEAWGPFGRGWSVKRFSAQLIAPQTIPLIAWPKAWSHGLDWPVVADVVYLDAKSEADLEKYRGQLKGSIVLISSPREVPIHFEPLATRQNETNLLRLANAAPPAPRRSRRSENAPRPTPPAVAKTNAPPTRPVDSSAKLRFAVREGAALTISISSQGDGGTVLVGTAMVVPPSEAGTNRVRTYFQPWATNAPAGPPQLVLAAEQYNRLVRMIQAGEKLKMAVEVQTEFHDGDRMCYNTLAEIPGRDLADELVMLGAHLDSEPGGTGAADNAAGVAVCMEAVRLLKALNFQPRRTVRLGLWTGEEQGLLGSKAYVTQHFGEWTLVTNPPAARSPKDTAASPARTNAPSRQWKLNPQRDYKRFSAYYNLDNGAGRIRGIHLQGNEALRPIFRPWLEPLRDLGVETISASNTGGTDHESFDAIGLPGFQFIQDPVEYWRTYHTTMDVRERAPLADLQQAAIVMAAFVYHTAMLDERLPRKPTEEDRKP